MNNKILQYVTLAISVIALLVSFYAVGLKSPLGGDTNFDSVDVTDGYKVDGTTVISGSGTLTIGSGGTTISKYLCGTATWNPTAVTSSSLSYTTTTVTVTGAAVGDVVIVSLGTSTSSESLVLTGQVSAASTVLMRLRAVAADVDLTTTTVKACVIN